MTVDEMHIEFERRLDKIQSSSMPEFTIEEIDSFLNIATLMFIKTRYNHNNLYRTSFEESQKRRDDLREIVVTSSITPVVVLTEDTTVRLDLNALNPTYMFYVRGRVRVQRPNCPAVWNSLFLVQQDDLETVKSDPFNKPRAEDPVGYFEDGQLYVITDATTSVLEGKVTYVKYPTIMVHSSEEGGPINSELSLHTHDEIVELAVKLALNQIESPREQTQQGILTIKE